MDSNQDKDKQQQENQTNNDNQLNENLLNIKIDEEEEQKQQLNGQTLHNDNKTNPQQKNDTQQNNKDNQRKKKQKNEQPPKPAIPSFKIIVLHGFQQYRERIEEKILPWIKFFKRHYEIREVLLPEAPNRTLPSDPEDPFRCWLALNKDDPLDFDGRWSLKEAHYHFYEESEEHLLKIFEDNPDIDIMINFSQGSLIGSLFYGNNRHKDIFKNLKMIINICGVGLPTVINENLTFVNELYEEKNQYEVPTLFLIGEKDQVVPLERTQALMKWYKNKQILKFDGPHCIPKQILYLQQVKTYIDSVLQNLKESEKLPQQGEIQ